MNGWTDDGGRQTAFELDPLFLNRERCFSQWLPWKPVGTLRILTKKP